MLHSSVRRKQILAEPRLHGSHLLNINMRAAMEGAAALRGAAGMRADMEGDISPPLGAAPRRPRFGDVSRLVGSAP